MASVSFPSGMPLSKFRFYDAFLSFCAEDHAGKSFASDLYIALSAAGVYVYLDDDQLERGNQISSSRLQTIERSPISVVILTENYAKSRWCLEAIENIIKCYKTKGQKVIPVFYGVEPSDLLHQEGGFVRAFKNFRQRFLGEKDTVMSSKEFVLGEVSRISGFAVKDSWNVSTIIESVVEDVTRCLSRTKLLVVDPLLEASCDGQDVLLQSVRHKKVVLRVELSDDKIKTKAIKAVATISGVESVSVDMKSQKLTFIGDVDPVKAVLKLRKLCHTEILSIGPAKTGDQKKEAKNVKKKSQEKTMKLKLLEHERALGLTQTADNLESPPELKDCPSLPAVSHTIGQLHKLSEPNSEGCKRQKKLPRSIYRMKALEKLTILPNIPSSRAQAFVGMSSVVHLSLPNTNSRSISSFFYELPSLQTLSVGSCSETQLSRDETSSLDTIHVVPYISGSKGLVHSLIVQMGKNCQITCTLRESILQKFTHDWLLPDDNYPDWLTFKCDGSSILFEVPEVNGRNLKTMTLCILYSYSSSNIIQSEGLTNVLIVNHTKATVQVYKRDTITSENPEWHSLVLSLEPGNRVEVVVVFESGFIVKKSAIYLVYDEPNAEKKESWRAPDKNIPAAFAGSDENPRLHDVFLNFRGDEDISASFTSHLYTSIRNAGIHVFGDNEILQGEHKTLPSLQCVIEKSTISVVVFSRNYADSTWCLEELEKIMQCQETKGQVVVPVFYGVDPSEVRNQTSKFGEAFEHLFKKFPGIKSKQVIWRKALSAAGAISGFVVNESRSGSEVIKNVVERVTHLLLRVLDRINLFIDEHLVGVESRVQTIIHLLNNQGDDVRIIGIWGMGGIGKTTIAKAIYNQICCNFDGSSFLLNIKEAWQQEWHVSVQERLLSDIYLTEEIKISSIESGRMILKDKLCDKKVLLVFDDVDKLEQLKALCGSHEWFGPGSIIIITTRDKYILKEHGVDHVHTMKEMDVDESLELFSWHVFQQPSPRNDFAALCENVVSYCGGLPLALKVIGTELFGKGIQEWEKELDELKRTPHPEIQKVLQRSYDDLKDDAEKAIFLDIAFFFIAMDRNFVIQALKGFGEFAETMLTTLEDQTLVTSDDKNNVRMHVLLREMGRQIFREQSRMETGPRIYDVFLSFRGVDTRPTFTSHLYTHLQNAGIYVFKDNVAIQRGDQISISLLQAIGRSRISIIVLSRNYANSRWCMVELEKIMECHRTTYQFVIPIFYDVEPTHVRRQTGMFGEAFNDLLKRISISEEKEQSWRIALREIGAISGSVVAKSSNESEEIKKIVEDITRYWLDRTDLSVADHPVGVEARMQEAIKLLNNQQPKDVKLLGIWGIGGIGKTTIAKSIYNRLGCNFEARSILQDISVFWSQNNGLVSLQEQILNDIFKTMKITIHSIAQGREILKERLRQKKILLVLDDINNPEQLNALCASHEWFCPGSCIIITTRDERLVRVHGLDSLIYRLKAMDEIESVELFRWYAFERVITRDDLDGLCRHIVAYCGGLPLALQIIGSHLLTEDIDVWKSVLEDLKSIPNLEIHKKLRISYDGLSHDEKEIFLHIACFFIGMDRYDVIHILMECGFIHPEYKISSLVKRSLVIVDYKNKIGVHDLLRNMGREIVCEESPEEPYKRSRLCHQKEVREVLSRYTGTEAIVGLSLKYAKNQQIPFWTDAFEKMKKLKFLQFSSVRLYGDFKYLSRDLTWLNWQEFPLPHTPEEFYLGSLVALALEYSKLKLVWKEVQLLKKLKIVKLSHSPHLRQTPDFSFLPNLQKLILEDCPGLSSVSDTIGDLKEIILINLKDCTSLCDLPRSIYKLKSLKTLILSGCSKIDIVEEDLEQMESLTTLMADNTAIKRVPISVVRLKSIGYISLCGYQGFSHNLFPSLIWSWMSPQNNLSSLVQPFMSLSYLVSLELDSSNFPGLSFILEDLPKLRSLSMKCDLEDQLDQHVERILDALHATNGKELEAKPSTTQFSNILAPKDFSVESFLTSLQMNFQVASTPDDYISQIGSGLLPEDNCHNWLAFSEGSSVIFEVPREKGRNMIETMCIVYCCTSSSDKLKSEGVSNVLIINYVKTTINVYKRDALIFTNEEWQRVISDLEPGNKVRITVVSENGITVKWMAVYLLNAEPIDKNMDLWHHTDYESVFNNEDKDHESVKPPIEIGGTSFTPKPRNNHKNTELVAESSSRKSLDTLDLPAPAIVKGKAPIDVNTSDEDPFAEIEDILSGSHNCSSPKSVKPSSFCIGDTAMKEALINLECLLKNSLPSLIQDPVLYQQFQNALMCLFNSGTNLPYEVVMLVESMMNVVDRFPSIQDTINFHINYLEKKESLSQNSSDAKHRHELLVNKISKGNSEARRLDAEIAEVSNKLGGLIKEQEKLAVMLGEYEVQKKKLIEEAHRRVHESKEVMSAIERSEPNYRSALKEQTEMNKEWEHFRSRFAHTMQNLPFKWD